MNAVHVGKIAQELKVGLKQVESTAELLVGGATVPFIARYRKEATAGLDEVAILAIRDRLSQLEELDKRREAILNSLTEQNKLTDELQAAVTDAQTMTALEDIYLPYRPKRRTRAMIAREKGLEPLALRLLEQTPFDIQAAAAQFVSAEKGVEDAAAALAGARDIIAEIVNEDAAVRTCMRELFETKATYQSKVIPGKEAEGVKYKDYYDWTEPAATAPSHRILAMRRGEAESILSLRVLPAECEALDLLHGMFVKGDSEATAEVRKAVDDSYGRLLSASMETDIRLSTRQRAEMAAITVFADNLRELLLSSPLGRKTVLALDPGFRTGCKLVVLDPQGKLLHYETIFPHEPANRTAEAGRTVSELCERFKVQAIAIGNGTAGRETETFCQGLTLPGSPLIVMVNESGASVYSASEVARDEFPDQDLTVRGAVSIGRRLMDPLAELVKIDPKSIGVGQYQHDVDQGQLKTGLDDVVSSCVNSVGVELNTASKQLLSYVSGLGPSLAGNIVAYRNEHGPFNSRNDLLKVARLGPKAFEQAAGFLRIRDGANPLDASAVHPESYPVVEKMAADANCSVTELIRESDKRQKIELKKYVTETVGLPTLTDILSELAKPGRDPRKEFEAFSFAKEVHAVKDLQPGMRLPGIVTNVAAFGAFVDVGVHQDGLVHVSQLADRFVKSPSEVVKVGQRVMVTVLEVDLERNRISLSLKTNPAAIGGVVPAARKTPAMPGGGGGARNVGNSRGGQSRQAREVEKPFNNPFVDFFKDRKPPK